MTTSSEREPLSAIIAEMLGSQVVTVGEVADRVAQRGFGLIMSVLALPTMIPVLPPGSAAFIGLLYILLAVQMLIGLPRPWLPVRVRNYRLTSGTMRMLQERGIPLLRRVERLARPRATWVPDALVTRAVAVAVLLLGIVLLSPLPFFNTIPAMTVLILGIGLFNRDALFLLGGLVATAVVVAVAVAGADTLIRLAERLTRRAR
ncbi:MAG: exopolysaccharide biosynthesis protein [Bacillati bacterium ANGP1]|uniref:Exopolysaccharide biosynthesis protein n=1 Tax=Candidatus Segetimicrobium genomatis TaxID=2569760 RepID=A0A537LGW3_9BACT|nr:MAG: hypothetical protein AUI83_02315 [Armatimonadetes bacterium 13_1_40CM_3_65_7]TMJ07258.1 MAG: exopolysaccharide biosynthesis protein [Terrabacteria group bacterium ANGP1]TMJ13122.1 MAG: exopolysaccharide biosynthesis protein [Terrabacteria group bacterium ANGP1]